MALSNLVFMVLLAVFIFWAVGAYNRLIRLKNAIAQAFGAVDVQLKRRDDLIASLVEAAEKHPQQAPDALQAVMAARKQARSASDVVRSRPAGAQAVRTLSAAEQVLDASLTRLFAAAQAYPELEADTAIGDLGEALSRTQDKAGFARQAYNEAVLAYNQAQSQFPALLIARLFGFSPSVML